MVKWRNTHMKKEWKTLKIHPIYCSWDTSMPFFSLLVYQPAFKWNQHSVTIRSHLDNELEPKEPTLQNMGLLPGLEPMFRMRLLSGERAAAAMGCEVAVRLAKGFSSLAWVDIISTSIKICPIKSLKSENTVKKKRISILTSVFTYTGVRCKY